MLLGGYYRPIIGIEKIEKLKNRISKKDFFWITVDLSKRYLRSKSESSLLPFII